MRGNRIFLSLCGRVPHPPKRGYRIHWIYSSAKRLRDRQSREARLAKAEQALMELNARLNTRTLKQKEAIEAAVKSILEQYQVDEFLPFQIGTSREEYRIQVGKGRPGKQTRYKTLIRPIYTLTWTRNLQAMKQEARVDGLFLFAQYRPDTLRQRSAAGTTSINRDWRNALVNLKASTTQLLCFSKRSLGSKPICSYFLLP